MGPYEFNRAKFDPCQIRLSVQFPAIAMSSSINQPNTTLYINNLNDKVNKEELKIQLLALFATYGKIIDIVASKSQKMKGQAFLVFADLASATSAMRACEGMIFYDKPLVNSSLPDHRLFNYFFFHLSFSISIMRKQGHTRLFEAKIPNLCHQPRPTLLSN